MILDRVTITGADDTVDPQELMDLSEEYPFVEWGILFSKTRSGSPRYPNNNWLDDLWLTFSKRIDTQLSAHLCGDYARQFIENGDFNWYQDYRRISHVFRRVQINHKNDFPEMKCFNIIDMHDMFDFVFQHTPANADAFDIIQSGCEKPIYPLYDQSGGQGVLPANWRSYGHKIAGYAGGLNASNLEKELHNIAKVVPLRGYIWINIETGARTSGDRFSIHNCHEILKIAKPFINQVIGR